MLGHHESPQHIRQAHADDGIDDDACKGRGVCNVRQIELAARGCKDEHD